jgi:hypothetical protein
LLVLLFLRNETCYTHAKVAKNKKCKKDSLARAANYRGYELRLSTKKEVASIPVT